MKKVKLPQTKVRLSSAILLLGLSTSASAINGVFDYGMGQINRAMGGAGVAMPQDAFATMTNPGGLSEVKHNFDAGAAIYFPMMYSKFSAGSASGPPVVKPLAAAPGTFDSQIKVFFMPDIGYIHHLDKQNHFGLSLTTIGGFGSKYETNKNASTFAAVPPFVFPKQGLFGDGTIVSSLKIGSLNASYNYVIDRFVSVGATLSYYVQAFESKGSAGLAAFATRALLSGGNTAVANKLSNNGTDYNRGVGITVGALVKAHPMVTLAASIAPTVKMSKLEKYKDLMAEGGRLDIPGKYTAGVRVTPNDKLNLVADVVRIFNRDVATYGNNSRALIDGRCSAVSPNFTPQDCMGGSNGVGFGWRNQTLLKVGGEYKLTSKDTARFGVSYGNRIGTEDDIVVAVFAPGAAAEWVTSAGYTRVMKNYKINSFLTYIPKQTMSGVNELSAGNAQTVKVAVHGFGFGVGVSV